MKEIKISPKKRTINLFENALLILSNLNKKKTTTKTLMLIKIFLAILYLVANNGSLDA